MAFRIDGGMVVLELETRRHIYGIVRRFAGCHFREIERKSGMATGTVKYHLDYLERHGLIIREKDGNSVRFFPSGFDCKDKHLLAFLRQASIRKMLIHILTHKRCNQDSISNATGLSPSTISFHSKKLSDAGVISCNKEGKESLYALEVDKDDLVRLFITHRESLMDSLVDKVIDMWDF